MKGLGWKLNRMRAMNVQEVLHRIGTIVQQRKENLYCTFGRFPSPSHPVTPKLSLFSSTENWALKWKQTFSLDCESLSAIIQGDIEFFGDSSIHVGNPVQWHRDPATGIRSPLSYGKMLNYRDSTLVGNIKILWELGRHQHLIPLAVAYAITGEQLYRNAVLSQIEHWIQDNPFGMGIHWCSSLEVALRLISWSFIHSLFTLRDGEDGIFAGNTAKEKLGLAIYQQAWFIRFYLSQYSSANNHLIGELTGLWIATQVFDWGQDGIQWSTFAKTNIEQQASLQVHTDGVHKEQALYYHLWVLEYFLVAWLVGERQRHSFSKTFKDTIVRMAQFVDDMTPEGGLPSQIGDGDDGTVVKFEPLWSKNPYFDVLSATHTLFNMPSNLTLARSTQKAFFYTLIVEQRGSETTSVDFRKAHKTLPMAYPDGGYVILREGDLHIVFDVGPLGYTSLAAHGHADSLSFCVALGSDWWLVDPGTFCYHDQPQWRDYFRGTAAHNTVTVDNCNQSVIGGPFLWTKHANSYLEHCENDREGNQNVSGWHDGYHHLGITHHRELSLKQQTQELIIIDHFAGQNDHHLAIHFHFAPDVHVRKTNMDGRWEMDKPDSSFHVSFSSSPTWNWEAIKGDEVAPLGWFSKHLGTKEPTYTLRGQYYGTLPLTLESRFRVRQSCQ